MVTDFEIKKQNEQKVFDEVYDKLVDAKSEEEVESVHDLYQRYKTPLGDKIMRMFGEAERDRRLTEQRWIKDLRQYRGEYDPEVLENMDPNRSRAFLSLTRTKVKTVSARMTDLLFPANGDKNWGIQPTPVPELDPSMIQSIQLRYQEQTGEQLTEEEVKKFINDEAVNRSDAMEKEMADQLSELKYREIIRNTILSGNLYGTGILKGPLAKTQKSKRWLPDGDEWVTLEISKTLPYCEFVPVWDIYPDMTARRPDDMRYCFQRYVMTRNKLFELSKREDFFTDAIVTYLKAHPEGSAQYKPHEHDLLTMNDIGAESGTSIPNRKGRYELTEFWGFLDAQELQNIGVAVDPELIGLEVAANVWMVDDIVIKAIISPIEGVAIPYHFYYYDKDDSSIWGEGIPAIMRDSQALFNAAVRAMLDNAAISAGPILEANMDLLDNNEDPKKIHPFRVFVRDGHGADASAPAVRVYSLPSYTNEFMGMINFFMNANDEVTAIPRYMYGDTNQVGGAGKTATGLSMLMGAANVTLKDQIKNFDDGVTVPFIKSLYFWNMDFNTKEYIKGDFNIVARGASSLIAREVKAEALTTFMQATMNDVDLTYTKRDNVLREFAKVLDLDEYDLIKDKNTVQIEEKARSEAMEEEANFQKELAMIKAKSGGHMEKPPTEQPQMESLSPEELQNGEIPDVSGGGLM
jgi:hypothetical protein